MIAALAVVITAFAGAFAYQSVSSSAASPIKLGEADGAVPEGVTVFDDEIPGVTKLDPDLLKAVRQAARAAAGDGVEFRVNSGWRSPAYQSRLRREAISQYGSAQEAARWVATPATSPHVKGEAIDLGPAAATAWLSRHGARYGLCQIYRNEPWHYELRPKAAARGCPPMYADPTRDPRMRQRSARPDPAPSRRPR
ncbi:M15 family metallopeptidase [Nonomuraea typhae]|uniref:M15 family metallopeptidase n=1 Tax=Nonomuraea typhae TaxID=2603600 RepID=UPI001FEAB475|nr:M15 family metallopeptidase [Nonomuraea typhae]